MDATTSTNGAGARPRASGGTPLLEARHVVKRFGSNTANDDVSLKVMPGEIHALLGENGAGKSTLVKILYGALQPNAGEILWKGRPVSIASPAEARALGIGMVFQHFSLFEALTVAENIALAMPKGTRLKDLAHTIETVSRDYGLPLDPGAYVADLSVGERQRVEIVRCLLQDPELIIMDEPTSVLTPQEADQLFVTLKRLASEGCAILYISHRLEEVRAICDHATVMRRARVVAETDPGRETVGTLARLMVGAEVAEVRRDKGLPGRDRLVLDRLSVPSREAFGVSLKDVSLAVRAGEIVAIAGVAGNGQSELFDVLSGETSAPRDDMIRLDGAAVGHHGVNARRRAGAAFVPEERLGHGAVPGLRLSENVVLTRHGTGEGIASRGFTRVRAAGKVVEDVTGMFDVRKGVPDPEARSLSGGNLQKFVVGREVHRSPGILVVAQPTWGVDAGAAAVIRQAMIDLARGGAAVLVISQDLDEIFEVADRIAVISRGHLSPATDAAAMTRETIGLLMAGGAEKTGGGA
ncbi:ABC transporter ATP-binding protein [Oharaeibacter diazotrophicus]|uniref:Simple sugar transport system ATP-binding protein n=1 Tax=Oharaeibacter diazotrophicus TaxID=1920512 RepID=A0A4R6RLP7_9HYPH|nr:ABC transporter ATP-binding protein [Oharaeibacter diazotrophicus]TDP87045.1 simple sugar transport system ATP-binding protein [Oharaeibacter diazotrophicus]BBE71012.1 galactose/methylgalactoside import ATP-binding protein MglA [Pleomorphomonas sp. SM30]GLS77762.1 ABC transporter [Oharaeibacter diazotrophicus]